MYNAHHGHVFASANAIEQQKENCLSRTAVPVIACLPRHCAVLTAVKDDYTLMIGMEKQDADEQYLQAALMHLITPMSIDAHVSLIADWLEEQVSFH